LTAAGTVGSDTADEPDVFPGMAPDVGNRGVAMTVNKIPEVA